MSCIVIALTFCPHPLTRRIMIDSIQGSVPHSVFSCIGIQKKEATQTRAPEDKRHGHVQDMRVHIRGDVSGPSKHALVTHVCPHSAARWVAFDLVLACVSYGARGELKLCPLDGTSELKKNPCPLQSVNQSFPIPLIHCWSWGSWSLSEST